MQKLQQWGARFDVMSLRERVLILVTVLVALAFPSFVYLIEPAQKERVQLRTGLQALKAQAAEGQVDYQLAKAAKVDDPNIALQHQVEQLEQQLQQQTLELKQRTASLVTPEEMVGALQQMMQGHQGVRLLGANKAEPLSIGGTSEAGEPVQAGLYRHDLELLLEGSFFQVKGFLKTVEEANKSLFWESLDYQVEQYPNARVRLRVYTLSTTQEWLGV